MNFKTSLAAFLFITTLFMACDKDNFKIIPYSNITTTQHVISDFDDLDISHPFNVSVTFSDTEQSLQIEANDNLHSIIEIEQINGRLSISLENNTNFQNRPATLNVFLTTNNIATIKAVGAASVHLQNIWDEGQPEIELTGASLLTGQINADLLIAKLLGASNLNIEGNADRLEINSEGASNMEGFEFEVNELSADLTGASNVSLTIHDKMSVDATGASTVFYKGNGIIENQNLSGGSQIVKMD